MLICLAALGVAPALGCDLCGCYAAREARITKPGSFVGVYEQYTRFGTLQEDGREMPNEIGQYLNSSITQLLVGYQFGDRLSVQLNLPLIHRSYRRPGDGGIEEGSVGGLGDAAVTARYRLIGRFKDDSTLLWHVQGGVKMPTGDSDRLLEELNEMEPAESQPSGIHGHDLTLGSGSWDGILGTALRSPGPAVRRSGAPVRPAQPGAHRLPVRRRPAVAPTPGVYLAQDTRHSCEPGGGCFRRGEGQGRPGWRSRPWTPA